MILQLLIQSGYFHQAGHVPARSYRHRDLRNFDVQNLLSLLLQADSIHFFHILPVF